MFLLFSFVSISGQELVGAWERIHTSENGQELKSIVIFSENYQTISTYELSSGKFISSNGGSWNL